MKTSCTRSSARSRSPMVRLTKLSKDRKSTRLNSSHLVISYAVFCLKKKKVTSHILCCHIHAHTDIASLAPVLVAAKLVGNVTVLIRISSPPPGLDSRYSAHPLYHQQ